MVSFSNLRKRVTSFAKKAVSRIAPAAKKVVKQVAKSVAPRISRAASTAQDVRRAAAPAPAPLVRQEKTQVLGRPVSEARTVSGGTAAPSPLQTVTSGVSKVLGGGGQPLVPITNPQTGELDFSGTPNLGPGELARITPFAGVAAPVSFAKTASSAVAGASKSALSKVFKSAAGKAPANLGKAVKFDLGGQIPVNTVNAAKTSSWLSGLSISKGLAASVTGAIMGAIGSYPFAGFIKEEALQTLSFATKTAIDAGDLDLAEQSIAESREVLDPSLWGDIIGAVPYANVVGQLQNFYDAATTKLEADEALIANMRQEVEAGPEQTFAEQREQADLEARERELAFREEDSAFFAQFNQQKDQPGGEKDFEKFKKSQLNFGILG